MEFVFPSLVVSKEVVFTRGFSLHREVGLLANKVYHKEIQKETEFLGMKKCEKCLVCSCEKEGDIVKADNFTWKINKKLSCQFPNIIY